MGPAVTIDVLIVGAGPTGLVLAAQLQRFGVRFRLVDSAPTGVHESRALAVQARSLEILQTLGIAQALVDQGNRSARLMLHFDAGKAATVELGGFGRDDTRFPFILFVSQAQTEALLGEHVVAHGTPIERGVRFVACTTEGGVVQATLRRDDGSEERVHARYLVGCDGAHSSVRKATGIPFEGDAYLQAFVLGDIEVEGPLQPDTLHAFPGAGGIALLLPLRSPATWRVIATSAALARESARPAGDISTSALSLAELQATVDVSTGGTLRLAQPAWLAKFHLHHRQAQRYRAGPIFLAGDAAHVHSPVGAQGMNTGIQDAWNLGWKLALVGTGAADAGLLDSYERERWPVGRLLLRSTDRAFTMFLRSMSTSGFATLVRRHVVPHVVPAVLRSTRLRKAAFHFISQLGVRYRNSPAVEEGRPLLRAGPKAGDRLPDLKLVLDGTPLFLHDLVAAPCLHLLLCGPADWDEQQVEALCHRFPQLLKVHRLPLLAAGEGQAHYLVRPDGHIGYRCAGTDLEGVGDHVDRLAGTTAATGP